MFIRIEKAPEPTPVKVIGVFILALTAALLVAGGLFSVYGLNPLQNLGIVWQRTFGNSHGWSEIVRHATPLMVVGLGMLAGGRAQFWNLGAEGQMLVAAITASGIALFVDLPAPLVLPVMFLLGGLAAGLWALIPCLLKAKLGISEIITGLMMNYVAANLVDWLIQGPWRGAATMGYSYTDTFPKYAWLPLIPSTRVHWPTTVCGIALAITLHFLLFHTRLGFNIRVLGENPIAGRYVGLRAVRIFFWVGVLAGGMAGVAGVGEVAGVHHKLLAPQQITLGYGFASVIVALLARGEPLYVLGSSLLLGMILASSDVITVVLHLPAAVTNIFTGLILYFVVSADFFLHYRVRFERRYRRELETANC
jgi:general nucleoside transport system permease protein